MSIGTPVNIGTNRVAAGSSTATITTTTVVNSGDLILVIVNLATVSHTINSVTDSAGNTYTAGNDTSNATWGHRSRPFYCPNARYLASGSTITVTFSGTGGVKYMNALSISGVSTSTTSSLDVQGPGSAPDPFATSMTVASGTLSQANEIAIGWVFVGFSAGGTGFTDGSGFTNVSNNVGTSRLSVSQQIVSSTSSVTYNPSGWANGYYGGNVITFREAATPTRIFLTTKGANTWTVPSDWNNDDNTIETIGGGAGGYLYGAGGGGGAYSRISNLTLTPGASITTQVGANGAVSTAGGDSWFNASNLASSSVGSKGGSSGVFGGTGGANSSGIGTTKFSGGNGSRSDGGGAGGGGAAGRRGPGKDGGQSGELGGTGGAGGGGAGGGSSTAGTTVSSGTTSGAGGAGSDGTGGGATNGGVGSASTDHSGGGGGGGDGPSGVGGAGGAGKDWDATHGSGGGGGGGASAGGVGALYGGGGASSAIGGQGIIVITYTPTGGGGGPTARPSFRVIIFG